MSRVLSDIVQIKKNSSSSTVQFFAKYKKKTDVVVKAHLKLKDEKAFRKELFDVFKTDQIAKYVINAYNKHYVQDLAGMEYENKIYSKIIKEIIDKKISPNFVEFVALGSNTFNDFMQLFYPHQTFSSLDKALKFLISMINPDLNEIFLLNNLKNRIMIPHLQSDYVEELAKVYINHIEINYVITKLVKGSKNTIKHFISYSEFLSNEELKEILFQLFFNLYLIEKIKLQHNDLHSDNILIETLPKKKKISYKVDEKIYTLNTRYLLRFYDWDMAYVDDPYFGLNLHIDNNHYRKVGIQNRYVKNFDFYHIVCFLHIVCFTPQLGKKKTICKSELFKILFKELIQKNKLQIDKYNILQGFDIHGKFMLKNSKSVVCRANNEKMLLEMPELKSLLQNDVFKDFENKKRQKSKKIHGVIQKSLQLGNVLRKEKGKKFFLF